MSRAMDEWKELNIENVPENIRRKVMELLSIVHNRSNHDTDVDKQCRKRFGITWQEVRKQMDTRVTRGFLLIDDKEDSDGFSLSSQDILRHFCNKTGNWMTNKYLWVLYLKFSRPSLWQKNLYTQQLENPELLKSLTDENMDDYDTEKAWFLFGIAPYIALGQVQDVLSSYGLEMTD
jgi:hypothetical protein